jgi:hypothetical protein
MQVIDVIAAYERIQCLIMEHFMYAAVRADTFNFLPEAGLRVFGTLFIIGLLDILVQRVIDITFITFALLLDNETHAIDLGDKASFCEVMSQAFFYCIAVVIGFNLAVAVFSIIVKLDNPVGVVEHDNAFTSATINFILARQ